MTREEIAKEADQWLRLNGLSCRPTNYDLLVLFSQHIASLAAAAEREACAKLADEIDPVWESISDAIRARGQQ